MPKYRAKRTCYVGLELYHEGVIYAFDRAPDPELFADAARGASASARPKAARPAGRPLGPEDRAALGRASRAQKATTEK